MSSNGPEPDGGPRALLLVLDPEPDMDPEVVELAARRLRAQLKELNVESVAPVSEDAPEGAKGAPSVWAH